jgi:DNA polymerase III epsilon subunit-like protein
VSKKALAQKVMGDIARLARELGYVPNEEQYLTGGGAFSKDTIELAFSSYNMGLRAAGFKPGNAPEKVEKREPKILLFDLETAPLRVFTFGLFDQNIGLNQIDQDWFLLAFSAKWLGNPAIYYADQSKEPDLKNDKRLLGMLWHLLNEADVVITQNGRSFDEKVANARFIIAGLPPIKKFKHIDTKILAKRRFRFTSNKLEYLAKALDVPVKKLAHKKFPGFELWAEVMKGNQEAWAEMKSYCMADTLSLEGVYERLAPWGIGVNLNAYHSENEYRCQCGSIEFEKKDFERTPTGKHLRLICKKCNAWHYQSGAENNHLGGAKKSSMKTPKEG